MKCPTFGDELVPSGFFSSLEFRILLLVEFKFIRLVEFKLFALARVTISEPLYWNSEFLVNLSRFWLIIIFFGSIGAAPYPQNSLESCLEIPWPILSVTRSSMALIFLFSGVSPSSLVSSWTRFSFSVSRLETYFLSVDPEPLLLFLSLYRDDYFPEPLLLTET